MKNVFIIARADLGEILRMPLYYLMLLVMGFLVYASKFVTLFTFSQEINTIREMGIATMSVWGFLIVMILATIRVTEELESRTAITLLTKPVGRTGFLLGKALALFVAAFLGIVVLALILLYTLWTTIGESHLETYFPDMLNAGAVDSAWDFIWDYFLARNGLLLIEGAILATFQTAIFAAIATASAAFFPAPVTIALSTFAFILGNLSTYMVASIAKMESAIFTFFGSAIYYIVPNFSDFNLQSAFAEGRIISWTYIAYAGLYGVLYCSLVLFLAARFFEKKEIT